MNSERDAPFSGVPLLAECIVESRGDSRLEAPYLFRPESRATRNLFDESAHYRERVGISRQAELYDSGAGKGFHTTKRILLCPALCR